jgi:hypothetical protein
MFTVYQGSVMDSIPQFSNDRQKIWRKFQLRGPAVSWPFSLPNLAGSSLSFFGCRNSRESEEAQVVLIAFCPQRSAFHPERHMAYADNLLRAVSSTAIDNTAALLFHLTEPFTLPSHGCNEAFRTESRLHSSQLPSASFSPFWPVGRVENLGIVCTDHTSI